jgi:hypothetical protein
MQRIRLKIQAAIGRSEPVLTNAPITIRDADRKFGNKPKSVWN